MEQASKKSVVRNKFKRMQLATLKIDNKCFPVYEGVNTVGRNRQATINIKHINVSHHHAVIVILDNEHHFISDLQSSNNTLLGNSKLIPFKLHKLTEQEEIKFGDVVAYYYMMSCEESLSTENEDIKLTQNTSLSFYSSNTQILVENGAAKNHENVKFDPSVSSSVEYDFKCPSIMMDRSEDNIYEAATQVVYHENIHLAPTQVVDIKEKEENIYEAATQVVSFPLMIENIQKDLYEMPTQKTDNIDVSKTHQLNNDHSSELHDVKEADNLDIHKAPTQIIDYPKDKPPLTDFHLLNDNYEVYDSPTLGTNIHDVETQVVGIRGALLVESHTEVVTETEETTKIAENNNGSKHLWNPSGVVDNTPIGRDTPSDNRTAETVLNNGSNQEFHKTHMDEIHNLSQGEIGIIIKKRPVCLKDDEAITDNTKFSKMDSSSAKNSEQLIVIENEGIKMKSEHDNYDLGYIEKSDSKAAKSVFVHDPKGEGNEADVEDNIEDNECPTALVIESINNNTSRKILKHDDETDVEVKELCECSTAGIKIPTQEEHKCIFKNKIITLEDDETDVEDNILQNIKKIGNEVQNICVIEDTDYETENEPHGEKDNDSLDFSIPATQYQDTADDLNDTDCIPATQEVIVPNVKNNLKNSEKNSSLKSNGSTTECTDESFKLGLTELMLDNKAANNMSVGCEKKYFASSGNHEKVEVIITLQKEDSNENKVSSVQGKSVIGSSVVAAEEVKEDIHLQPTQKVFPHIHSESRDDDSREENFLDGDKSYSAVTDGIRSNLQTRIDSEDEINIEMEDLYLQPTQKLNTIKDIENQEDTANSKSSLIRSGEVSEKIGFSKLNMHFSDDTNKKKEKEFNKLSKTNLDSPMEEVKKINFKEGICLLNSNLSDTLQTEHTGKSLDIVVDDMNTKKHIQVKHTEQLESLHENEICQKNLCISNSLNTIPVVDKDGDVERQLDLSPSKFSKGTDGSVNSTNRKDATYKILEVCTKTETYPKDKSIKTMKLKQDHSEKISASTEKVINKNAAVKTYSRKNKCNVGDKAEEYIKHHKATHSTEGKAENLEYNKPCAGKNEKYVATCSNTVQSKRITQLGRHPTLPSLPEETSTETAIQSPFEPANSKMVFLGITPKKRKIVKNETFQEIFSEIKTEGNIEPVTSFSNRKEMPVLSTINDMAQVSEETGCSQPESSEDNFEKLQKELNQTLALLEAKTLKTRKSSLKVAELEEVKIRVPRNRRSMTVSILEESSLAADIKPISRNRTLYDNTKKALPDKSSKKNSTTVNTPKKKLQKRKAPVLGDSSDTSTNIALRGISNIIKLESSDFGNKTKTTDEESIDELRTPTPTTKLSNKCIKRTRNCKSINKTKIGGQGESSSSSPGSNIVQGRRKRNVNKRNSDDNKSNSTDSGCSTPKKQRVIVHEELLNTAERCKRKQRPKVVFTMLDNPQLESLIKQLGGSVVDTVDACTVVVTEHVKRSQKLLSAVGQGKPICPPKWIQDSKKANEFLDPWNYILMDTEAEHKWDFSLGEALKRSTTRKILHNYFFQLIVNNAADVLKGAIEACGGKIVARYPGNASTENFFIVSTSENKSKYVRIIKQNPTVKVIQPEAIFDGVLRQELRFEKHYLN